MVMTLYEVLQVTENASPEVIQMAYKALVKKYHPDVNRGFAEEANKMMKAINEAYDILSDAEKRKQYDEFLREQRQPKNTVYTQTERGNVDDVIFENINNKKQTEKETKADWNSTDNLVVAAAGLTGIKANYFYDEFKKAKEGESCKFNWAAFLLGWAYPFYRRCPKIAFKVYKMPFAALALLLNFVVMENTYHTPANEALALCMILLSFMCILVANIWLGSFFNREYFNHCLERLNYSES